MNFQEEWDFASSELGLDIEAPFEVTLTSGATVKADVLLRSFGCRKGMLLFAESKSLEPHQDEVVDMGFGFSILGHPSPNATFDRESFIEMLSDWGWSGEATLRPTWLLDVDYD